jgi:hypothetical protein
VPEDPELAMVVATVIPVFSAPVVADTVLSTTFDPNDPPVSVPDGAV